MKTIKKEALPCPTVLPGPHSIIFFVNRVGLIGMANGDQSAKFEMKAVYTTPANKVLGILGIAKQVGAKRAFEIGTCAGGTSANLYLAGMHVETIDLHEPLDVSRDALTYDYSDDWILVPQNRMFIRGMSLPIVCHVGDTRTWKPGPLAGTFDLVFVDGDHTTAMAKNDTALALDLLRPGGTIVWDDAGIETVTVALRDFEVEHGEITLVECGCESMGKEWPIAFWTQPSHA